jgi:hypothetical protein
VFSLKDRYFLDDPFITAACRDEIDTATGFLPIVLQQVPGDPGVSISGKCGDMSTRNVIDRIGNRFAVRTDARKNKRSTCRIWRNLK